MAKVLPTPLTSRGRSTVQREFGEGLHSGEESMAFPTQTQPAEDLHSFPGSSATSRLTTGSDSGRGWISYCGGAVEFSACSPIGREEEESGDTSVFIQLKRIWQAHDRWRLSATAMPIFPATSSQRIRRRWLRTHPARFVCYRRRRNDGWVPYAVTLLQSACGKRTGQWAWHARGSPSARGTRLSDGAAPAVSGTRCASSALKSVGRVGHALV
jgi:hypothetical protein